MCYVIFDFSQEPEWNATHQLLYYIYFVLTQRERGETSTTYETHLFNEKASKIYDDNDTNQFRNESFDSEHWHEINH